MDADGGGVIPRTEKLLRKMFAFPKVDSISVRDSYEKVQKLIDDPAKLNETFDAAINCSRFYPASPQQNIDFGIGCISSESSMKDVLEIIQNISRKGYKWKLFTNGNINDYNAARKILTELGLSDNIDAYLFERPTRPAELIQHITSFRYIISFRLHSLIIASSFGIPSAGIVWDNKIIEFYKKIGFENRCYFSGRAEEIDYEDICDIRKKEMLKEGVSKWMQVSTDMLLEQCKMNKKQ